MVGGLLLINDGSTIMLLSTLSGPVNFSFASDSARFSLAVRYHYPVDLNDDGIDEVIYAGFETQYNTPAQYTNTQVSIFAWLNGQLSNVTSQWLPSGANLVEGVGDVTFGDFNGDGRIDAYLSGNADMDYELHAYVLYNQGNHFSRVDIGLTEWEHGVTAGDLNNDGYDDVVVAGYNHPSVFLLGSPSGLVRYTVPDGQSFNSYETHGSGATIGDFLGNGRAMVVVVDSAPGGSHGADDTRLLSVISQSGRPVGFQFYSSLPMSRMELTELGGNLGVRSELGHDIRARSMDFSDDGLMDVLVFSRAGYDGNTWPEKSQVQFLENLGSGQFRDVTSSYLLGYELNSNVSYNPIFADVNLDGRVDIFLSESSWEGRHDSTTLLLAQQDGTYVDTGRLQLSALIDSAGGMATLVRGPDQGMYVVTESQSYGGASTLRWSKMNFPERDESESLLGTRMGDEIYGLGGADSVRGGLGDDYLNGGIGIDYGLYVGGCDDYVLRYVDLGIYELLDTVAARDGEDILTSIERLQFADVGLALDLDGHAGQVAKILGAVFGKSSLANKEYVGIGLELLDGGTSYHDLMTMALSVSGAITPDVVVTKLWTNIIGTSPTVSDKAPFIDMLNQGMTHGALGIFAADTQFNATNINLIGLTQTGLEYL